MRRRCAGGDTRRAPGPADRAEHAGVLPPVAVRPVRPGVRRGQRGAVRPAGAGRRDRAGPPAGRPVTARHFAGLAIRGGRRPGRRRRGGTAVPDHARRPARHPHRPRGGAGELRVHPAAATRTRRRPCRSPGGHPARSTRHLGAAGVPPDEIALPVQPRGRPVRTLRQPGFPGPRGRGATGGRAGGHGDGPRRPPARHPPRQPGQHHGQSRPPDQRPVRRRSGDPDRPRSAGAAVAGQPGPHPGTGGARHVRAGPRHDHWRPVRPGHRRRAVALRGQFAGRRHRGPDGGRPGMGGRRRHRRRGGPGGGGVRGRDRPAARAGLARAGPGGTGTAARPGGRVGQRRGRLGADRRTAPARGGVSGAGSPGAVVPGGADPQ